MAELSRKSGLSRYQLTVCQDRGTGRDAVEEGPLTGPGIVVQLALLKPAMSDPDPISECRTTPRQGPSVAMASFPWLLRGAAGLRQADILARLQLGIELGIAFFERRQHRRFDLRGVEVIAEHFA